jgi:hypothetical protein
MRDGIIVVYSEAIRRYDMTKRGTAKDKSIVIDAIDRKPEAKETSTPGIGGQHPLNDIIGTHTGPAWDAILKNIDRNRKRVDREYAKETK